MTVIALGHRIAAAAITLLSGTSPDACLAGMELVVSHLLPDAYREVSGMAGTPAGLVWIHGDERAQLALLDPMTGEIRTETRMGSRARRGDFEGATLMGGALYLVTSDADLLRMKMPAAGHTAEVVEFERARTDLRRECEIEGLEADPEIGVLLIACKTPYRRSLRDQTTLFRWDVAAAARATPDRRVLDGARMPKRGLRTSGIARDPRSGQWVLISSLNHRMVVLDSDWSVLGTRELGGRHPQPEAVAWLSSGHLVIGDEGQGGAATVTVYRCGR